MVRLDQVLDLNHEKYGPRLYNDRHGHVLPPKRTLLQTRLNETNQYAEIHQLKINEEKTKIMSFNNTFKYDFFPKYFIRGKQLEVVNSTKLLGIHITSNMKWNLHTQKTVAKAKKKLWYLRRLSQLKASVTTLLDIYHKVIRSVMEQGAPIYTGGLTKTNIDEFESVQKCAFRIILRGRYYDYNSALNTLEQLTLEERRRNISLKFAKKSVSHPKMKHLFKKQLKTRTRGGEKNQDKFIEPRYKTDRANNGPVNYLIRLLNSKC